MTITAPPHPADVEPPASRTRTPASDAPPAASRAPDTTSDAQKRKTIKKPGKIKPTADRQSRRDRVTKTLLLVVAAIGGTVVGAIGFAMSYSSLAKVALSWGFSPKLAPWFPIGVDASIVAFLALDLYLIWRKIPWSVLRLAAHAMTGATIWFNASSQGDIRADPVQAASHGVMPVLFVIGVEATRRLVIQAARLEAGTATDRIPFHRWVLDPKGTWEIFRRMRLWGITSYEEMIRRDQDLLGYQQWLERKYEGDLSKAEKDELLPMTMAEYGYTVKEALRLPEQQERAAQERKEEAERRERDARTRKKLEDRKAEAEVLRADGELKAVRADVDGKTAAAEAQAAARTRAAQQAAALEEQALESATMAEAKARRAEAERKAEEEREKQAAAAVRAAELERQAAAKRKEAAKADQVAAAEARVAETARMAEDRKRAAEADRLAAEEEKLAAETRRRASEDDRVAAEDVKRTAVAKADTEEAEQRAAEAEQRASEARLATAEVERRALEAEDAAKLTPRERSIRKVARMLLNARTLLDAEGQPVQVHLADIEHALDIKPATACEYKKAAVALLEEGVDPTT